MSGKEIGVFIELPKEGGAAEAVIGILQTHGLPAFLLKGETPTEADFVICGQYLPEGVKSQLRVSPFVAYVWDEEGMKAFVERIPMFNSPEKLLPKPRFGSSKEAI